MPIWKITTSLRKCCHIYIYQLPKNTSLKKSIGNFLCDLILKLDHRKYCWFYHHQACTQPSHGSTCSDILVQHNGIWKPSKYWGRPTYFGYWFSLFWLCDMTKVNLFKYINEIAFHWCQTCLHQNLWMRL